MNLVRATLTFLVAAALPAIPQNAPASQDCSDGGNVPDTDLENSPWRH